MMYIQKKVKWQEVGLRILYNTKDKNVLRKKKKTLRLGFFQSRL